MLGYLKGKIDSTGAGVLYLDVNGVGYKIFVVPTEEYQIEKSTKLYIHEHIREDAHDLYGFASFPELELFEKLISVNGVGPKAGLLIMSSAESQKIISAIVHEDISFFTALSGIGKKVAAKIILELKSKLSGIDGSGVIFSNQESSEVVDALLSLGYKKVEISQILSKIPTDVESSEDKIRWALKHISRS